MSKPNFFDNDPIRPHTNSSGSPESEAYNESMKLGIEKTELNIERDGWVSDTIEKEEVEVKSEEEINEVNVEEESQEAKEEQEIQDDNIKRLSAFMEDRSYEIPAEAKLKHKVDGEEVEVTVQELLNNYSGKQAWDKKFSELDKERQVYKKDLEFVDSYISKFSQKSKENPVEALEFLAQSVGLDPFEYKKNLRNQLISHYKDYLEMTDQERFQYEQREELDYLKRQRETERQRIHEEQAQRELQGRFNEIQQTYQIDEDRMNYLKTELVDFYKTEVTPENVAALHEQLVRLDRVDSALEKLDKRFLDDDNKVLTLESFIRSNPHVSDEEIFETAKKLWGADTKKVINEVKRVERKSQPPREPNRQEYKPRYTSPNSINLFEND